MILSFLTNLFKPVAKIIGKRQERKLAKQTATAKIAQSTLDNSFKLDLNRDEWEALQVKGMADSWKDEYATVSVISILNIIVVGGMASAFGYPQILTGIATSITALGEVGVDIGFLLEAAVLSALGLSVWKRV